MKMKVIIFTFLFASLFLNSISHPISKNNEIYKKIEKVVITNQQNTDLFILPYDDKFSETDVPVFFEENLNIGDVFIIESKQNGILKLRSVY